MENVKKLMPRGKTNCRSGNLNDRGISICDKKVGILKVTKQRQVSQNTNNQDALP